MVIVVTMIVFVNVMLSEEVGKLLAPYRQEPDVGADNCALPTAHFGRPVRSG